MAARAESGRSTSEREEESTGPAAYMKKSGRSSPASGRSASEERRREKKEEKRKRREERLAEDMQAAKAREEKEKEEKRKKREERIAEDMRAAKAQEEKEKQEKMKRRGTRLIEKKKGMKTGDHNKDSENEGEEASAAWEKVLPRAMRKRGVRHRSDTESSAMEIIEGSSKRAHSPDLSAEETDNAARKAPRVLVVNLEREDEAPRQIKKEPTQEDEVVAAVEKQVTRTVKDTEACSSVATTAENCAKLQSAGAAAALCSDEILAYCLEESRKVGKTQASYIMTRVNKMTSLIRELLVRNSYLEGRLTTSANVQSAPSDKTATRITATKAATPAKAAAAPKPSPRSFAEVLGRPAARTAKVIAAATEAPKRHEVRIRPDNIEGNADSEKTKSAVLSLVDPRAAGIGIRGVRKTRDGAIIVETATDSGVKAFIQNPVLKKAGLTAEMPTGDKPRIIVYDVPRSVNEEELAETIRSQNFEEMTLAEAQSALRIVHKTGSRERNTYNAVLEVSPAVRARLLGRGRLYVGWNSCRISDYLQATRCYKCHAYGHVAKYCKAEAEICGHCARAGHDRKDCPYKEKDASCVNCKKAGRPSGHSANSPKCPVYIEALERRASRINYNGY